MLEELQRQYDNFKTVSDHCAKTADYNATNWTRLKYAGNGLFSLEEDIYNPANFIALIQRWEAAAQQAKP